MPFTPEELEKLEALAAAMNDGKKEEPKVEHRDPDPIFKVNFGGQEIEYKTQDELSAHLERIREAQIREAQAQAYQAALQQAQQARTEPTPKEPKGEEFDQDTYAKLFVTNPVKAHEYINKFTHKDDAPVRSLQAQLAEVSQVIATQQFLNENSDYEATEANKQAMFTIMQQAGLPWTAQGLNMAYAYGKQRGVIKPKAEAAADPEEVDEDNIPTHQPKKPAKAPSLPRRSRTQVEDGEFFDRFESLPLDKQREYLESLAQK
jgi:hypothetical protein